MSWQQTQNPNLDPYISQGGHVLTDWLGWCLAYVQTAFGSGWAGSNAWDSWNNHTVNRHEDWNLPSGVYVPIFFSGYHDLGHAAIYKDGQVWSSPISHKPTADVWGSIQEVEQHYGVTYVGWAEGLGGTPVVQSVNDAPPYTISNMAPKQLHVVPNHYKWNLAQPTFQDVVNNPITTSGDGGVDFTAVATLTRSDAGFQGYTYYLDDANTPHGWNTLDCVDATPPQPMPTPYVPPAAPVPVNKAEKYEVFTTLPAYASADEVAKARNPLDIVQPGSYYVWDKQGSNNNYWNLSHSNSKDENLWINIIDNKKPLNVPKPVEPPKPTITIVAAPTPVPAPAPKPVETSADVMASWKWFYKSHDPVDYRIAKPYTVYDQLHGGRAIRISPGLDEHGDPKMIEIYGTFEKAGITYLRPLTGMDSEHMYYMYGIPTTDIYTGVPYLNQEFNVGDKVLYGADMFIDKTLKTIEGIWQWQPIKKLTGRK